jgi:hypothetical protein
MAREERVRAPSLSEKKEAGWKRERKVNYGQQINLPNVDVHGILFAVVAVVFVVYPLAQYLLGL